jgi:hypothetical protein
MKISHEVPLSLLDGSKTFNDYDYCLPHLIDKYEQYKDYFIKARNEGRFIIMDNGLFEGVTHTTEDLVNKINLIKPDIFIVPDAWNNTNATYKNAKYWFNVIKVQLPPETKLMVVIQGKTMGELINLYTECEDLGYKHFAFNHSSSTYQQLFYHPNKLFNQMNGRQYVVSKMRHDGIIKSEHYIHLLGASLPQEFLHYQDSWFNFIRSMDTSSPIINGALGIRYKDHGLLDKPTNKIEEFFEDSLENRMKDIIFNLNKFKGFVN